MLNLLDYLTEKDNTLIENYINLYAVSKDEYVGNETWLKYWKENKPSLFHLLGGNLIYKVPYEAEMPRRELSNKIFHLISNSPFVDKFYDKTYYHWIGSSNESDERNPLEREMISNEMVENLSEAYSICASIRELCSENYLVDKSVDFRSIKIKSKNRKNTLQISKGMKPIKAIQAVLKYFDCFSEDEELWEAFKEFENKYSMILNTSKIKCNICFSIHPLDFMTSSDNANNWSSCMNWTDEDGGGCYHEGTIEMMNSNNVICVYLDSSTPYIFNPDMDSNNPSIENYTWNNKKWRQYFYCTKEIILGGKAYPYTADDVTKFALQTLRELAEKNWHHTYEFGPERYQDMRHIFSKGRIEKNRNWIAAGNTTKHNIIFDTKGMYNDMLNDNDYPYLCIRNKVKKNIIISCSGKAPCPRCMNPIIEESCDCYSDYGDYNDRYDNTGSSVCSNCLRECRCESCGRTGGHLYALSNGERWCGQCIERRLRICPDCGEPFIITENGTPEREIYMFHDQGPNNFNWAELKDPPLDADSGVPLFSKYCCCRNCRDKLKESSGMAKFTAQFQIWNGDYHNYPVSRFKNIIDFNSSFAQEHLRANLQKISLE